MVFLLSGCKKQSTEFTSPDKNICIKFYLDERGIPYYNLSYKNELLIKDSQLGLHLEDHPMDSALTLISVSFDLNKIAGSNLKRVSDSTFLYNELTAKVARKDHEMDIIIRLYNEGVAIRYWLRGYENVVIEGDMTEMALTSDGMAFWSCEDRKDKLAKLDYYRGSFDQISDVFKNTASVDSKSECYPDSIYVNTPFLFRTNSGKYLNFQQLGLSEDTFYKLRMIPDQRKLFSSVNKNGQTKIVITLPYYSQWQTIGIAESSASLLASNMIYNLSIEEDQPKEEYRHPITEYNNNCYNNVVLPFSRHYGGNEEYALMSIGETACSTIAHQLGLHVVFNRPLSIYENHSYSQLTTHPVSRFLKELPAEWGETLILGGELGEFVVVARKDLYSDNWFIGGVGNGMEHEFSLSLDFLAPDKLYKATLFEDGKNADWLENPTDYTEQSIFVRKDNSLTFRFAPGGGFGIILKEVKNPYGILK